MHPVTAKTRTANCVCCGQRFEAQTVGDRIISLICSDECYYREKTRRGLMSGAQPSSAKSDRWLLICPPRYAHFDPEKLPDRARAIMPEVLAYNPEATPHQGVAIVGPSDTGKSMLIHEAARLAFKKGYDVFVTCAADFAWRAADVERRQGFLRRCLAARILVFDDVGKGRLTDRVEADFFHVLDHRERWGLPLLWSANSKGQALRQSMTEDRADPILNRLRRSAKVYAI